MRTEIWPKLGFKKSSNVREAGLAWENSILARARRVEAHASYSPYDPYTVWWTVYGNHAYGGHIMAT